MKRRQQWIWFLIIGCFWVLVISSSGCKRDYYLDFHVENGESLQKNDVVKVDGAPIGRIVRLERNPGSTSVRVVFDRSALPEQALHTGIEAKLSGFGTIEVDTSDVQTGASRLKSG